MLKYLNGSKLICKFYRPIHCQNELLATFSFQTKKKTLSYSAVKKCNSCWSDDTAAINHRPTTILHMHQAAIIVLLPTHLQDKKQALCRIKQLRPTASKTCAHYEQTGNIDIIIHLLIPYQQRPLFPGIVEKVTGPNQLSRNIFSREGPMGIMSVYSLWSISLRAWFV